MNVKLKGSEEINNSKRRNNTSINISDNETNYQARIRSAARFLKEEPIEGEKQVAERMRLTAGAITATLTNLIIHAVRHSDSTGNADMLTINPVVSETFTNLKNVIYIIVQNIDANKGIIYEKDINNKIELLNIYIENILEIMNVSKDAPQIKDIEICIKTIHEEFQIF